MTSLRNLLSSAFLLGAVSGAPLAAQSSLAVIPAAARDSSSHDSTVSLAGPRLGSTTTGVRRQADVAAQPIRTQPVSMGKPMALMIVGGAAFVLGAVIGSEAGTLFMIGGAAAFLIGLYQYVK